MNILHYIAAAIGVLIVYSGGAIVFMPDANLVPYAGPAIGVGIMFLLALDVIAVVMENRLDERGKKVLMGLLVIVVLAPSIFASGAYIHQVAGSWSNGFIHWHADYEVIVDGERMDLIGPHNYCREYTEEPEQLCLLNDRIGTPKVHEHNDNRIHLEGTFYSRDEVTLGAFFDSFGGTLTDTELAYPTDSGMVNVTAGDGKTLKVLVASGIAQRQWRLLDDPEDYVIAPYGQRPRLDDIFIIYDETLPQDALQDVQEDDAYTYGGETFEITKTGEAY